ncbi:hypothetical protein [Glaciibacter superstes]|uniref:hypothetical protein n=1 Tax=Glaciibacter superstes TaxID=501023 RepID=UPI0003B5789B|nr:hypothetical protein [Glaciibacter superstes]
MHELTLNEESKRKVTRANALASYGFVAILAILGALQLIPGLLHVISGNISAGLNYFGLAILCFVGVAGLLVLASFLVKRLTNRSRVVFGDGSYTVYGLFSTKRFTVDDIERVVPVRNMKLGPMSSPSHLLLVVGHTRRLALLAGEMWTTDQLETLVHDMTARGVQVSTVANPITPPQLRGVDPRLLHWHQAHPVAAALIAGGIVLVLVIVALIVIFTIAMAAILG